MTISHFLSPGALERYERLQKFNKSQAERVEKIISQMKIDHLISLEEFIDICSKADQKSSIKIEMKRKNTLNSLKDSDDLNDF